MLFTPRRLLPAVVVLTVSGAMPAGAAAPVVVLPRVIEGVARLEPTAVLAAAQGGHVDVVLAGTPYALTVRPAPWGLTERVVELHDDGTTTVTRPAGPSGAFVGSVDGFAGSAALLTVTPAGVDGWVAAAGRVVTIVPRQFSDLSAEAALADVRSVPTATAPKPISTGGETAAQSTRYVELLGLADSQFHTRYGAGGWSSKVDAVRSNANSVYIPQFGWGFTQSTVLLCTTTTCDSTNGVTSFDPPTLLFQFAGGMKTRHDQGWTFDSGYLYSGKNFNTTVNGRAYGPGRYAIGQFVDEGNYNPSSSYEAGQVMAHELGHTLNAEHDDNGWQETTFHCDLGVPLTTICLQGHEVEDGPRHWTVMCGNCNHQPPNDIWDQDFSQTSANQIVPCHDGSWFNGTYVPTDPAVQEQSMNMGANC